MSVRRTPTPHPPSASIVNCLPLVSVGKVFVRSLQSCALPPPAWPSCSNFLRRAGAAVRRSEEETERRHRRRSQREDTHQPSFSEATVRWAVVVVARMLRASASRVVVLRIVAAERGGAVSG